MRDRSIMMVAFVLLLVGFLSSGGLTGHFAERCYLSDRFGDINHDDSVDQSDRHILETLVQPQGSQNFVYKGNSENVGRCLTQRADLNGDGVVDTKDLVAFTIAAHESEGRTDLFKAIIPGNIACISERQYVKVEVDSLSHEHYLGKEIYNCPGVCKAVSQYDDSRQRYVTTNICFDTKFGNTGDNGPQWKGQQPATFPN